MQAPLLSTAGQRRASPASLRRPLTPVNRAAFQQAGFRAEDVRVEHLRPPPLDAVRRFFRACDAARGGAIAVHCRRGRGRAAAMAGLWLMREYRLTAREATV